jgi:hypothetical protein
LKNFDLRAVLQPLSVKDFSAEDDHTSLELRRLLFKGLEGNVAGDLGFHLGRYQFGRDAAGQD